MLPDDDSVSFRFENRITRYNLPPITVSELCIAEYFEVSEMNHEYFVSSIISHCQ